MKNVPNHSQASLCPSELVTIGILHAFKGAGLAALAFLHAEHLLALAVVLLDFPADAAHTLHGDDGILGQVVSDDKFPSGWPPQPGTV